MNYKHGMGRCKLEMYVFNATYVSKTLCILVLTYHIKNDFILTWIETLGQVDSLFAVRILKAESICGWSEGNDRLEGAGCKHEIYVSSDVMV